MICGIDPGPTGSAYVILDPQKKAIVGGATVPNNVLLDRIISGAFKRMDLVIEGVTSYGKPVGKEVFETVYWSGRFHQAYLESGGRMVVNMPRREIKTRIGGKPSWNDKQVRGWLIILFGGKKAQEGPLAEVHGHEWAALAAAVAWGFAKGELS